MKKYWMVFNLSWQRELAYRFNFILGRLRSIIMLLLLYFVWTSVTAKSGIFAHYSEAELITYVFAVNILRSVVFGAQSRQVALEINEGWFSKYLLSPVHHLTYEFFRQLAERSVHLVSVIIEVLIFAFLFRAQIVGQTDLLLLLVCGVSVALSIVLYYLISYIVSLLAFWTRENMGPRFLFEFILEFTSGAYFPLDILIKPLFIVAQALPFMYLVYAPITIYLGKYSLLESVLVCLIQIGWIVLMGLIVTWVWKRGLRRYTGEGI